MRLVVLAAAVAKAQYFTGPDGKQYYTGPGSPWDTSRYNTRPHEKFRADRSTDYPPAEACDADGECRSLLAAQARCRAAPSPSPSPDTRMVVVRVDVHLPANAADGLGAALAP